MVKLEVSMPKSERNLTGIKFPSQRFWSRRIYGSKDLELSAKTFETAPTKWFPPLAPSMPFLSVVLFMNKTDARLLFRDHETHDLLIYLPKARHDWHNLCFKTRSLCINISVKFVESDPPLGFASRTWPRMISWRRPSQLSMLLSELMKQQYRKWTSPWIRLSALLFAEKHNSSRHISSNRSLA